MSIITETSTDYRVEVTRVSHVQNYTPDSLNKLWALVDKLKGQQDVKRIRVYCQMATFDIQKD